MRWPDLERAGPLEFRHYDRIASLALIAVDFAILAAMAHYGASVRWMIAVAFVLGALLTTGAVREAAYWLAMRR
jgi:hypothetical protein